MVGVQDASDTYAPIFHIGVVMQIYVPKMFKVRLGQQQLFTLVTTCYTRLHNEVNVGTKARLLVLRIAVRLAQPCTMP